MVHIHMNCREGRKVPDRTQRKPGGNVKEEENDCPWKSKKNKIIKKNFPSGGKVCFGILEMNTVFQQVKIL